MVVTVVPANLDDRCCHSLAYGHKVAGHTSFYIFIELMAWSRADIGSAGESTALSLSSVPGTHMEEGQSGLLASCPLTFVHGFLCVALAVLELALQTRPASNSEVLLFLLGLKINQPFPPPTPV